jgi:hypothetical protein
MLVNLTVVPPIEGTALITDFAVRTCDSLLADEKIMALLRTMDAFIVDSVSACATTLVGLIRPRVRVDFLPVTLMDPFMTLYYGMPPSVREHEINKEKEKEKRKKRKRKRKKKKKKKKKKRK